MVFHSTFHPVDSLRQTLRDHYRKDEAAVINALLLEADLGVARRTRVWARARKLVVAIREAQIGKGGVDALLQEFSLSSEEGVVLMCLAEALLRVPDKLTTDRLIKDKLGAGDWSSHLGNSDSLFVNASAWGLLLTGKVISYSDDNKQLGLLKKTVSRLGEPAIRKAVRYAMQIMGTQFVMGKTITSAIERGKKQEAKGYCYSYDMLGEGARTMADADRYFQSYMDAITAIGEASKGRGPIKSPGISVKLSAIHPRYEFSHYDRVMTELVPRLKELALAAKRYDIGFTVDAEEADRLDISLDIIEAVFSDSDLDGWQGFGLAIQAYQKRASYVIDWVERLANSVGRKMMVRLVKGAYWDSEIKWSQAEGLEGYPVFTRKASTDVSYQACAKKLLAARECLYPQFATHNAYTVATILELDDSQGSGYREGYEFQRLHGMGEALYDQVVEGESKGEGVACRIYAPVGEHADLLAYLVRRLLENGANSSFVNNIVDESVPVESLLEDPVETVRSWTVKHNTAIPLPKDLFAKAEGGACRVNSQGVDLTDINHLRPMCEAIAGSWHQQQAQLLVEERNQEEVLNPADLRQVIGYHQYTDGEAMETYLQAASTEFESWSRTLVQERAAVLRRMADTMESRRDELIALCTKEAGKTIADGVAEVREAVDFCRYYADRAEDLMASGELIKNGDLQPRGVILCISPWNFPLAIFMGQVSAALVTGNCVLAKPAEQTSLIAVKAVELLKESGLPENVVKLIIAPGRNVGEQLMPDARVQGVMFTGSTETGMWIANALAQRPETPLSTDSYNGSYKEIPLIAETGGQNCMIVDSTALPEQVVDDVIMSGFQSAGQRCSALRVLFLQEDVAPKIIEMIKGGMNELSIGDPALLSTDVGPVIDQKALARLKEHQAYMAEVEGEGQGKLLHRCEPQPGCEHGHFFEPHLYEINDLSLLKREVFGPVVHVIRYKAKDLDKVIDQINGTGYGLTLGVHSRIQSVTEHVAERAKVGNVYVNRNMIGAVVGVQPFGGHGLSGTGPKAGGPLYLTRLLLEKESEDIEKSGQNNQGVVVKNALEDLKAASATLPAGVMEQAVIAQKQWQAMSGESRVSCVRRLMSTISSLPVQSKGISIEQDDNAQGVLDAADSIVSQAEKGLFAPVSLPGPTGELNRLVYEARGVTAVIIDASATLQQALQGLVASLLAGNAVVLVVDNKWRSVMEVYVSQLEKAGMPTSCVQLIDLFDVNPVLSLPGLAGVVTITSPTISQWVQQQLAVREGAILSVIDGRKAKGLLWRMVVEKTISIDTTAAGGNTSLMTMGDSDAPSEAKTGIMSKAG